MNDEPLRKPRYVQTILITAFGLGFVLWIVWMAFIVRKTAAVHDNDFFVPVVGQTPPGSHSTPPTSTNAASTNGH